MELEQPSIANVELDKGRVRPLSVPHQGAGQPMRAERLTVFIYTVAILTFLGLSLSSLYVYPMPDSYRWYGDETWLMLAWRNLVTHGTMSVPIALGSTLQHSSGFLTGNAWISGVIYGLPQLLLSEKLDIIHVGRFLTFLLSLVTLGLFVWSGVRHHVRVSFTFFVAFLLLSCNGFIQATHSARYDTLTGLTVFAYVVFACPVLLRYKQDARAPSVLSYASLGFTSVLLGFGISPHLEVLLLPLSIFVIARLGALRSFARVAAAIGGYALGCALMAGVFIAFQHDPALFGDTTHGNQFLSVINTLPLGKLFSWSAQSRVLSAKLYYLWTEAPVFCFLLPLIVISEIALRKRGERNVLREFATQCLAVVLGMSFIGQSTLPYYVAHFLPLIAFVGLLHLQAWAATPALRWSFAIAALVILGLISWKMVPQSLAERRIGVRITINNMAAVQSALEHINRSWNDTTRKPLVLAQGPALHEVLRDTSIDLMSEGFLFFPEKQESPSEVLRRLKVDYVIDYHHPMSSAYETAVTTLGRRVFTRGGELLDRSCDYTMDACQSFDTLSLYQIVTAREEPHQ